MKKKLKSVFQHIQSAMKILHHTNELYKDKYAGVILLSHRKSESDG